MHLSSQSSGDDPPRVSPSDQVYVLKIEKTDLSQLLVGANNPNIPMKAMNSLLEEVKRETNNEADLRQVELLEFPLFK